jgi:hypothetical protein
MAHRCGLPSRQKSAGPHRVLERGIRTSLISPKPAGVLAYLLAGFF